MRVLVTGSEGSLMQEVIPHLLDHGHDVVGVDSFFRHGTIDRDRNYELIEGDLVDPAVVARTVRGVDGIIQAAARIFGVSGFHQFPADILSHDITLHQNVLWAAKDLGIEKVAYISSSMVFERVEHHPSKEEDVFEAQIPATDYGLSKLTGERLSLAFQQQYGLNYVIWRPFNIITPHEKAETEQGISHVFADFIRLIISEGRNPIPVLGDGSQVRCFTWIDDVASTIAKWSFDSATDNEIFNLGNPEPTSMKQLADIIYEEGQELGLIPRSDRPLEIEPQAIFGDDVKIRVPDVTKAESRLGFKPTKNTRESVRACLASLLSHE
ncbi:MAG: NAD(P)-dependent oxidoreductase [Pseudonocardiales bacterium]